ncbi:ATP-dependent zinc metalloprotease FtsH [Arenicella chitinivorans]|uniref:ATP-dependent zinc metalloprotease FtsH n=1 Tax=Arenicella chitinivorans TaxID=1329800 RepID=A0A918RK48_9GAMM|nr:ATP-dependent zinc metalloprotease FtsH [Arenicella chitinivorans]GGZ99520.1 ATP-dependent zinc metalloprotease FtsH [Arenicella chitinivorans]
MNRITNIVIVGLILLVAASWIADSKSPGARLPDEKTYSEFNELIVNGSVDDVILNEEELKIYGTDSSGKQVWATMSRLDDKLVDTLIDRGINFKVIQPEKPSALASFLVSILPFVLFIGVWIYLMRQMQGGAGKGAMSFGKSKARLLNQDNNRVTFDDVAGVEESKEEVQEIVEFLRDPSRFQKLGGRMPSGILMTGSPGTGKTLLAKAIAGEAQVPFFSISGSDFVEMFVGVGASRVRDMFDQAKKNAPCIIFIDEIDAVGRHRGAGIGGGNDEREQTLNQLLVEMDGFEGGEGIIVIAATNRPDVLDPALLRPGRFDRQVVVPLPDIRGREQILKVHMRKVPIGKSVDPAVIARGTPGFSGADIANLVNEAALFAARGAKKLVEMEDFEFAKDKVMMGAERRSIVMPEKERLNTAYHESGHAVVGAVLKDIYDPVHKVTIIPRGRALGLTFYLPEEDRFGYDREFLLARIAVALGGRIAEELFMNQMTTGASSDFESATEMAHNMVARWGMSDVLGTRVYGNSQPEGGLGGNTSANMSDTTANLIDTEVTRILDEQYHRAKQILEENRDKVEVMAKALMEFETLDAAQIAEIMEGKKPTPPADLPTPRGKGDSGDDEKGKPAVKPQLDNPASET